MGRQGLEEIPVPLGMVGMEAELLVSLPRKMGSKVANHAEQKASCHRKVTAHGPLQDRRTLSLISYSTLSRTGPRRPSHCHRYTRRSLLAAR
jgi:hypothetical protein